VAGSDSETTPGRLLHHSILQHEVAVLCRPRTEARNRRSDTTLSLTIEGPLQKQRNQKCSSAGHEAPSADWQCTASRFRLKADDTHLGHCCCGYRIGVDGGTVESRKAGIMASKSERKVGAAEHDSFRAKVSCHGTTNREKYLPLLWGDRSGRRHSDVCVVHGLERVSSWRRNDFGHSSSPVETGFYYNPGS
jgi:hypothetical protein